MYHLYILCIGIIGDDMKKENQKALPLLALLLAAAAILLVFAAPARAGAKAGLALEENTVLPSLLPLLVLFLMI